MKLGFFSVLVREKDRVVFRCSIFSFDLQQKSFGKYAVVAEQDESLIWTNQTAVVSAGTAISYASSHKINIMSFSMRMEELLLVTASIWLSCASPNFGPMMVTDIWICQTNTQFSCWSVMKARQFVNVYGCNLQHLSRETRWANLKFTFQLAWP